MICTCHKIVFLLFFSTSKNIKIFLAHRPCQNRQWLDLAHEPWFADPLAQDTFPPRTPSPNCQLSPWGSLISHCSVQRNPPSFLLQPGCCLFLEILELSLVFTHSISLHKHYPLGAQPCAEGHKEPGVLTNILRLLLFIHWLV